MFPDLGYVIMLLLVGSIILPILLLITMNIFLHKWKVRKIYMGILNFSFVILFYFLQREVNTNRSGLLILILEAENLMAVGLLLFLTYKVSRMKNN